MIDRTNGARGVLATLMAAALWSVGVARASEATGEVAWQPPASSEERSSDQKIPEKNIAPQTTLASANEPAAEPQVTEHLSSRGRVRVRALPGLASLADRLAATAEEDRDLASADLGRDWDGVVEVRLAPDKAAMQRLLPPGVSLPDWAHGVAFAELNLVVIEASGADPQLRATLRHELSHIAAGRLTGGALPRWMLEGLAELQERRPWLSGTPALRSALADGTLPSMAMLSHGFPLDGSDARLAYEASRDFVSWLANRHGEAAVRGVLRDVAAGSTLDAALKTRLEDDAASLERSWRRALRGGQLLLTLAAHPEWIWSGLAVLVTVAWSRARSSRRRRLAALEAAEEAERAELLRVLPARWAEGAPPERLRGELELAAFRAAADRLAALAHRMVDASEETTPSGDGQRSVPEAVTPLDADDEAPLPEGAPRKPTLH